jgi:hypothetical protein
MVDSSMRDLDSQNYLVLKKTIPKADFMVTVSWY